MLQQSGNSPQKVNDNSIHPSFSLSSHQTIEEEDEDAIGNSFSRPKPKQRISHMKNDGDSSSDDYEDINITYLNPKSIENQGLNTAIFS